MKSKVKVCPKKGAPRIRSLAAVAREKPPSTIVALAASVGGLKALSVILGGLPGDFPAAITIVMHLSPDHKSLLAHILGCRTPLKVREARSGDILSRSTVFVAPPNRHLLVSNGGRLKLSSSVSKKVHHSRPSAEPLFASLADIYKKHVIAVVLTGGDGDGSIGVKTIKKSGGLVIAQDQPTSQDFSMPESAIKTGDVDFVLPLNKIGPKLIELVALGEQAKKGLKIKKLRPSGSLERVRKSALTSV